MVRGSGSARTETAVKAIAKPKTMRLTMRCHSPRDALKNDLSTITISAFCVWLAMRSGMGWRSAFQGPFQTVSHGMRFEWLSEQTHRTDGRSSCFQPRLCISRCDDHWQTGVMG